MKIFCGHKGTKEKIFAYEGEKNVGIVDEKMYSLPIGLQKKRNMFVFPQIVYSFDMRMYHADSVLWKRPMGELKCRFVELSYGGKRKIKSICLLVTLLVLSSDFLKRA